MKFKKNLIFPILIVFFVYNIIIYLSRVHLAIWGINSSVLFTANGLILILHLFTLKFQQKALLNSNPNVFIRSVLSGMMIKMFACLIAILIYWFVAQQKFSNATVIAAMFIYVTYLAAEVNIVTKLNNHKNA